MAEAVIKQKRNILILGRTGAGKRTMANQIVNSKIFEPSISSMESATREATFVTRSLEDDYRKLMYKIAILDTYSTETSGKRISQDVSVHSTEVGLEGINLVIFAMRKGIYEEKELQMFNSILSDLNIRDVSALVITGCESLDDEERKDLVEEIERESATRFIARSMGKGIFPVGFPPLDKVKAALRVLYQDGIAADSKRLKDLAKNSGEVTRPMKDVLKKVKEANKSSEGFSRGLLQFCEIL